MFDEGYRVFTFSDRAQGLLGVRPAGMTYTSKSLQRFLEIRFAALEEEARVADAELLFDEIVMKHGDENFSDETLSGFRRSFSKGTRSESHMSAILAIFSEAFSL